MPEPTNKPGVFLSHTHVDKPFARRLADDLAQAGARVWIDDAEILVGDSLIHKIRDGIDEMDYLAVVLSPESVASEWVKKEVEIAMNQEIDGRRVKVLPLYYRACDLPGFLRGKRYADFSSGELYLNSLEDLLARLNLKLQKTPPASDEHRLADLTASNQLLAVARDEALGEGVTNATASAILASSIHPSAIGEFWRLVATRVSNERLLGVALCVLDVIEKFDIGYDVMEYCLTGDRLSPRQIESLGMSMQDLESHSAILWAHRQLTRRIKSDVYYNSFLRKHIGVINKFCGDDMSAYLLFPDRGPAKYNIDTFVDVIRSVSDPKPFVIRWIDWIRNGRFDGNECDGDESAELLYKIFNEFVEKPYSSFDPIVRHTLDRVYLLCKSREDYFKGFYHLVAMLTARYKNATYVLENILSRIYSDQIPDEARSLYFLLEPSFEALARLNREPESESLEDAFRVKWLEVAEADKVTGFWRGSNRFPND